MVFTYNKMATPRLNRISIVLDEFDFSQKDLAKYLKVSINTVSRWCRNINQPDLEKLYLIAEFFRIDNRRLYEPTNWEKELGQPPYIIFLEEKAKEKESRSKEVSKQKKLPRKKN